MRESTPPQPQRRREARANDDRLHRRLVDGIGPAIIEADPRTHAASFVSRQVEALLGHPARAWLENPAFWSDHLHPEDRDAVLAEVTAALEDGRSRRLEYRMLAADGRPVWLEDRLTVANAGGRPRRLGVLADIGERKAAEALEGDHRRVLELVGGGRPLSQVLGEIVAMIERHGEGRGAVWLTRGGPPELAAGDGGGEPQPSGRLAPVRSPTGTPLGWVALRGGGPDGTDGALLERAAGLAAMAVEGRRLADELAHQASHDALTGLPNRVLFEDRLGQALEHAHRSSQAVALFFVDLDRFKEINDTLGHDVGDLLLQGVARRLEGCLRRGDTIARMGGDEFTVILGEVTDPGAAVRVAEKLMAALTAPFLVGGHELYVTTSIGISLYPKDGRDPTTLQRNADVAMYRAKRAGKNAVRCFSPEMNLTALDKLELETGLRRALARGELSLHYHPQVELGGRLVGFEALLRWRNPKLGSVPPATFVPLAEESGLIVPVGEWALRQACAQVAGWRRDGLPALKISVNVSALQLCRDDFVGTVAAALADSGLPPGLLELELTESLVMRDLEASARRMGELRALGVSLSIDDFGTGYSSLAYLQRLPIDTLKVDRSFVQAIEAPASALPLVQAIVSLAHGLGVGVVAEGVETERQLEALKALGCDLAQGFLFAEPAPPEEVERFLHSFRPPPAEPERPTAPA